eukprot:gene9825-256_t
MAEGLPPPRRPNILVTGTPGVGKTTFCQMLEESLGSPWKHIRLGDMVVQNGWHDGEDGELQCYVLDEDKVCDGLEDTMIEGNAILDSHHAEVFPERWFAAVIVLRADTAMIYDRLTARGYSELKRENNVQAEIFGQIKEEAYEAYPSAMLVELTNDTLGQLDENVTAITEAVHQHLQPPGT